MFLPERESALPRALSVRRAPGRSGREPLQCQERLRKSSAYKYDIPLGFLKTLHVPLSIVLKPGQPPNGPAKKATLDFYPTSRVAIGLLKLYQSSAERGLFSLKTTTWERNIAPYTWSMLQLAESSLIFSFHVGDCSL